MPPPKEADKDRRDAQERRQRIWYALWLGSSARRRRSPRRDGDRSPVGVDWHSSQWLAISMVILLLSAMDAAFTLTLIGRGAHEANPFMAALVVGSSRTFVVWKLILTIAGVVTLVLLARLRLFGPIRVGALLYLVLGLYLCLIGYECLLLFRDGT
jgi:Domain of unknown function (DUF5658)